MRSLRVPKWIGWPLLLLWTYVVLSFLANKATFHPSKYPEGFWDLQAHWNAEDVWLDTADGVRIHGWMIEPDESRGLVTLYLHGNGGNLTHRVDHIQAIVNVESSLLIIDYRLVTLYLHGNGGNLTHRVDHIQAIVNVESSLLIIDYRGYGRSEGSPSEEGTYRDTEAAYDYLVQRGYRPEQIVAHGESLGTAMATDLASRRPCAGLVLEAPFPSARAVAARVLPVLGPLVTSGLETARKITEVKVPVLIIHGDRDEVIAYQLGREVFDAANEPKQFWTVEGAHHNDIIVSAGAEYERRLAKFHSGLLAPE